MSFSFMRINWQAAINRRHFIIEFSATVIMLMCSMMMFAKFTEFVEMRQGFQFSDPFLINFSAINLTWPIFVLIYGGLTAAMVLLLACPHRLMILMQAYALMVLLRMVMMYMLPLSPPDGIILLQDPVVQFFGTKKILSRDLFFSGHTSSLFLLYLGVPKKWKMLFLIMSIAVAVCVLLQKAHYTVDVLVAPFIAFCCYHVVLKLFHRRHAEEHFQLEFEHF